MDVTRCAACGAQTEASTRFCGACGALQPADAAVEANEPAPPPPRPGARLHRGRLVVLGAVAVVLLGGLLGTLVDRSPGSPAPDSPYLQAVAAIEAVRTAPIEDLRNVLSRPYGDRQSSMAAYATALEAVPSGRTLAAARGLTPPPGYESSHAAWLEMLELEEQVVRGMTAAVERDDLLGVATGAIDIIVAELRLAHASEPSFCEVLGIPSDAFEQDPSRLCVAPEQLRGGANGRYLWDTAAEVYIEVFPRITAFDVDMDDDEFLALLAVIQPTVEATFEELADDLRSTRTPPGLEDDTAALVAYLDEMGAIAAEITEAARQGDRRRLFDELFPRSAEPGERLAASLSDRGRDLLRLLLPT